MNNNSLFVNELNHYFHENNSTPQILADDLGMDEEAIKKWRQGVNFPNSTNRQTLIREKIFSNFDMTRFYFDKYGKSQKGYSVQNYGEFIGDGGDLDTLIVALNEIFAFYPIPSHIGNNMGDDYKWGRIYDLIPETLNILKDKDNNVVGLLHFIFVNQGTYKQIRKGNNINESIDIDDLEIIDSSGNYDAYIVDFFIHPKHNKVTPRKLLFAAIFNQLQTLAIEGVFIKRIIANISSNFVKQICINRGFNFCDYHKSHTVFAKSLQSSKKTNNGEEVFSKLYELDLTEESSKKIFGNCDSLYKLYEHHFGHTE